MSQKKRLLEIVRDKIRVKHYSISTEKTYVHWIKSYILFHNKKHPIDMGKDEIEGDAPLDVKGPWPPYSRRQQ